MDLYIEYKILSDFKKWPKNPKLHADELEDSIVEFGFVDPIILDEGTQQIVSGHGRLEKLIKMETEGQAIPKGIRLDEQSQWMAPLVRGVEFDSPEAAEKFLLSVNLLPQAGGWDELGLEEMMKTIKPFGIKIDLEEIDTDITEENSEDVENISEDVDKDIKEKEEISDLLDGVYRLEEEVYFFPEDDKFAKDCFGNYGRDKYSSGADYTVGPNPYGIPNLNPKYLIEELPEELLVWAGRKSTPDDEKSTYLWNYGAVPEEGLPYERSILSFFTHDNYINPWWIQTSYHAAKYISDGGTMAIVPDCSIWNPAPKVLQMLSLYKANWIGRWLQETKRIKIIPRLEFFVDSAKEFSLSGIPFESPIVATQMHTKFDSDDISKIQKNLEEATKLVKCGTLLVYVSERGRELINGTDLSCKVVMVETAKKFRAPRDKETREDLIKLKKERRKEQDPSFISNPEY